LVGKLQDESSLIDKYKEEVEVESKEGEEKKEKLAKKAKIYDVGFLFKHKPQCFDVFVLKSIGNYLYEPDESYGEIPIDSGKYTNLTKK